MTSEVPDWMNADFFKSCLESDEEDSQPITVSNLKIEPAVAPGNNYGSKLFRVKVDYKYLQKGEENSISLIVKAPITWDPASIPDDVLSQFYACEPIFYNEYVSETKKLLNHNVVPKHYVSSVPNCLVMEDLKSSGFTMANRLDLLDFDHCQLYAKASAKLHALSIGVQKTRPDLVERLVPQGLDYTKKLDAFQKGMANICFRCMDAWLEDYPQFKQVASIIKEGIEGDTLWDIIEEADQSCHRLKAIIQADPWSANMMFKYDTSGKVVSVKLLDFQDLRYSTPVKELISFLGACPTMDVRKNRLNEIYHLYCETLNHTLEEIGCPERLTFEELKEEIKNLSPYMVVIICMLMPFILADEPVDVTALLAAAVDVPIKENPGYKMYCGETFKKYCPQVLNIVGKEGVFNVVQEKLRQKKKE